MKDRFHHHWKKLPAEIRKPVVFTIGGSLVIISGLIGWLPGPGGIPLFLVGVAILATEFVWAEEFKNYLLELLKQTGRWLKARPAILWLIVATLVGFFSVGSYELYRSFYQ